MTLALLARRAWTQAGLLAAVLAVVVVGTTLLGTCALLLTTGQDRAQQAALRSTPAEQLDAEVRLTRLGDDPAGATATAAQVLQDALAPLSTTTSTWATSSVRDLPADADGGRATWPTSTTSPTWPPCPADGGRPRRPTAARRRWPSPRPPPPGSACHSATSSPWGRAWSPAIRATPRR